MVLERVHALGDATRIRQSLDALFGRGDALLAAGENLEAKFFFNLADSLGNGSVCDGQFLRGVRDRADLGGFQQVSELLDRDLHKLRPCRSETNAKQAHSALDWWLFRVGCEPPSI